MGLQGGVEPLGSLRAVHEAAPTVCSDRKIFVELLGGRVDVVSRLDGSSGGLPHLLAQFRMHPAAWRSGSRCRPRRPER